MGINTLSDKKLNSLTTPLTYGELPEYMTLIGNHPVRFTTSVDEDKKAFDRFRNDELFLLMLMTQIHDAQEHLPEGALEAAKAMNSYLEPSWETRTKKALSTFIARNVDKFRDLASEQPAAAVETE